MCGGLSGPDSSSVRVCPLPELRHKEVTLMSASRQSISKTALDVTPGGSEVEGVDALYGMGIECEICIFFHCQVVKRSLEGVSD